jgi:UDP-glucose 4-epimerase
VLCWQAGNANPSYRPGEILELAAAVLEACGRPELGTEFAAARPGDVHQLIADTQRAKALLGFEA